MASVIRLNADQADFLRCQTRSIGHAWEEYFPPKNQVAKRILACPQRLLQYCTRCGACKHLGMDESGELMVTPDYIHPEGYHWAKDEKLSTAQMRLIIIKRRGR